MGKASLELPKVGSVLIKNPRTLEILQRELQAGAGRSATEVAENLIAEGAEARQMRRVMDRHQSASNEAAA